MIQIYRNIIGDEFDWSLRGERAEDEHVLERKLVSTES